MPRVRPAAGHVRVRPHDDPAAPRAIEAVPFADVAGTPVVDAADLLGVLHAEPAGPRPKQRRRLLDGQLVEGLLVEGLLEHGTQVDHGADVLARAGVANHG